jgi:hypothetical protein
VHGSGTSLAIGGALARLHELLGVGQQPERDGVLRSCGRDLEDRVTRHRVLDRLNGGHADQVRAVSEREQEPSALPDVRGECIQEFELSRRVAPKVAEMHDGEAIGSELFGGCQLGERDTIEA